jgi:ADP-ribose pyrophosphatase
MEGNKNPSAVTIVAFTPEKKLVAIREYRYPLGGYVLALPAGIVDEGQTFEQTATDELYQETGLTLTETRTVRHNCFSSPGLTDEVITYVYGTAQGTLSTQNLQPGEKIEPVLLGLSELYNLRTTDSPISARLAVIVEMLCMVADLTEVTEIIR